MKYPPPVQVAVLGTVDVWNYYFFFFVIPLWLGGFIMGLAASYYAFSYRPKHSAAAYIVKKNLTGVLSQTAQKTAEAKEYIAESTVFSRSRKIIKQTFENAN
jgi:hypothetical protein